jgi:hypothetical protein
VVPVILNLIAMHPHEPEPQPHSGTMTRTDLDAWEPPDMRKMH